jgi:hypothetical protein
LPTTGASALSARIELIKWQESCSNQEQIGDTKELVHATGAWKLQNRAER